MKRFGLLVILFIPLFICFTSDMTLSFANGENHFNQDPLQRVPATGKAYKIGILQMVASLEGAVRGFKDGMKELGYIEGKNVEYDYKIANAEVDKIIEYGENFVDTDKDLIFCCSTPVTKTLKLITQKKKKPIPVVYTPVSDPVAAGIAKSWRSSGNNLTGVSSGVVTDTQLQYMVQIKPTIKRVLVISKKGDQSSAAGLKKIVEKAKELKLVLLVERPTTAEDIMDILDKTDFSKIDLIHIPPDTLVGSKTKLIYEATRKYKIPIIVYSPENLAQGGMFYYVSDYYHLGKQCARQADKILRRGVKPKDIPIETPKEYFFGFNLRIAREYGITIPNAYIKKALTVIR